MIVRPGRPRQPARVRRSQPAAQDAWEFDEPPHSCSGSTRIRFFRPRSGLAPCRRHCVLASPAPGSTPCRTPTRPTPCTSAASSAEARQDYDAAFDDFQKANAKNPKDLTYRTALYRVRVSASAMHITKGRKLLQAGDNQGALAEFLHAAEIDPGNEAAQQEIALVRQSRA